MSLDDATFDAVFTSDDSRFVDDAGVEEHLAVHRWAADADDADHALFVDPCSGPTLDLGCGPGRLVHALLLRGVDALGVDTSRAALGLAKARGRRVGELVAPGGSVLVEVRENGGILQESRRLLVDGRLGAPFEWAVVGLDAVSYLADRAHLVHTRTLQADGRWVAELHRPVRG